MSFHNTSFFYEFNGLKKQGAAEVAQLRRTYFRPGSFIAWVGQKLSKSETLVAYDEGMCRMIHTQLQSYGNRTEKVEYNERQWLAAIQAIEAGKQLRG